MDTFILPVTGLAILLRRGQRTLSEAGEVEGEKGNEYLNLFLLLLANLLMVPPRGLTQVGARGREPG